MLNLRTVLLVAAFICAVLAAFGVGGRVALGWAAIALAILALLLR